MSKKMTDAGTIERYMRLISRQSGKAVRPFRMDGGYINMLNKYGTKRDMTEQYQYQADPLVPDELLATYYEDNGLFARIIDTPAEEAVKHGFELEGIADQEIEDFYTKALGELDWEENVMTAVKWARLFGGSIAVMVIDDGRGLEEPLDWKNIRSIDGIRVYDRSLIQPYYESMYDYYSNDPFRARGSRLGLPEFYQVFSKFGNFTVHDSRCLVFQNGILPESASNNIYQFWGVPEYVRIKRAMRDAEVAHGSAVKLLDRSVQAVYKMKDLSQELATDDGVDRVLQRLKAIDMARGMLNSITIDSDGEDYDFKTFQFSGVSDVVDATCNFLSALTSIPQTILFGRSPAGMNSTGTADLENWYNYLERIQKRMILKNLRYLLSIIFQAGVASGEVDEVPPIKVKFKPLWSLSDVEQADLEQKKATVQQTRAQTAQIYVDMGALDPSEVRKALADSNEIDVETMLDELTDEELAEGWEAIQGAQDVGIEPGTASSEDRATSDEISSISEENLLPNSSNGGTINTDSRKRRHRGGKSSGKSGDKNGVDWITVNGAHIPLTESGDVATGGQNALKGKNFSAAESKPSGETKSSDKAKPSTGSKSSTEEKSSTKSKPKSSDKSKPSTETKPSTESKPKDKTGEDKPSDDSPDSDTDKSKEEEKKKIRKELNERIANGTYSTKLKRQDQDKHIPGTKAFEYEKANGKHKSEMTITNPKQIQQLIDTYVWTGIAIKRKGGEIRVEFVHNSPIGIYVSLDGKTRKITNCGTIHLSKNGAHIVPGEPIGGT